MTLVSALQRGLIPYYLTSLYFYYRTIGMECQIFILNIFFIQTILLRKKQSQKVQNHLAALQFQ